MVATITGRRFLALVLLAMLLSLRFAGR